ncbi:unnamed protein product [Acanthoscelides obtectus]|nr:unnamed protein product [Acanthoscelides obtectus]CAK1639412.1 hypothetical protein AOBTE_LOCUS11170 [Acanthoscelides obtectus]
MTGGFYAILSLTVELLVSGWLNNTYHPNEIVVTENGFLIKLEHCYMSEALDAIHDGINITGYSVWSLLDSFEWIFGYTSKYGLYQVDMADPQRQRRPKKSAVYYSNVLRTRCRRL